MSQELFVVISRTLIVFVLLVVLSRAIGKKLLSQMTFFDFVVGITIGTITGSYVVNRVKDQWVLVSPIVLTLFSIGLGYLTLKNLEIRKVIEGEPVVVIQNGKILEKNMSKLRYHLDDLEMQLRDKGIFNLGQVEFAVLEPHGKLSILKKSRNLPVTPEDLNIPTQYQGLSTEIIKNGNVLGQNLKQNNLTFEWLVKELKKLDINDLSEVVYASLNTDGSLYVDVKNDQLDYVQKVED